MNTPLRIVQSLPVSDSVLLGSDVSESLYPAWSAGANYNMGDRVHLVSTHKDYESVVAANVDNNPATALQWSEVGPTNRWAMFDRSPTTQTAKAGGFWYRLAPPGAYNVVALMGLTGAQTLRVRISHATHGSLFDKTIDLTSLPMQAGWWEWFYGERRGPSLAVLEVPGILGSELRIDVTGTTALAAGLFLFGQSKNVGLGVLQGARLGIQDFSRKETNEWGDTVLVQRAFAKRASFDIPVPADQVDEVISYLAGIRATPCLFIGPRYESAVIYGFYKEFDMNIAYASVSECSLEVEGMA